MTTTTTFNMLDFRDVSTVLRGHRDFLSKSSKERGTSLERTDRERRAQELPSRPESRTYSPMDTSALVSPRYTGPPAAEETGLESGEKDAEARPVHPDQRLAFGSAHNWSIGTTEATNDQAGQVEWSVAEALAGKESNARSRKASHSLRFFREGLPDEKGKKKEPRTGSQVRDKHPFGGDGDLESRLSEQTSPILDDSSIPTPLGRLSQSRLPTAPLDADPISESPEDYFLLNRGDVRAGEAHDPLYELPLPDPALRISDVEKASVQPPPSKRISADDRTGAEEGVEEADDSGEEKISSAVFLPHQGLEPSPELAPVPGGPPQPIQGPRTLSRVEDFHPWLVKTDDAEASVTSEDVSNPRASDRGLSAVLKDAKVKPDDSAVADESPELVLKPTGTIPQMYEEHVHEHQLAPSKPLDAIELIPYKHQVGGHTTLWRFSKRAVCKQLNNRENEFYERIEKDHRDLLAFLPRYIGVLNVTFKKQSRRRSTAKRDDGAALERRQVDQNELSVSLKSNGIPGQEEAAPKPLDTVKAASTGHHRVISQSLQSTQVPVPTVTFVDNQHILPRHLLQPSQSVVSLPGRFRSTSASASETQNTPEDADQQAIRPTLEDRHANSWGATTINKRLRNEVFNDAFLKRGPIMIQRHRRGHRPLPRRPLPEFRPTTSEPNLADTLEIEGHASDSSVQPRQRSNLLQSQSDVTHLSVAPDEPEVKDVTGTSAPEPETIGESLLHQRRKRRHSGSALRRKPADVRESRGDLHLFEELDDAGYGGDAESPGSKNPALTNGFAGNPDQLALSTTPSAATSGPPSPTSEFKMIPRPVNPKEAQTQRDSRVEYFLLLEDLTAGMKRPCIMDLKMGTRQYGVDAGPKKQKSQQGKCAKTTSRELGVRVCGLQVWDKQTQSYVFRDKYYGRNIKAGEEFQGALTRFLYDGVDYSSVLRHIPTILQKLSRLEVIISRLNGYRFYAASLLMFYDGDASDPGYDTMIEDSTTDFATDTEDAPRRTRKNKQEIDFKMADFANCITPRDRAKERTCPPAHPDEPDRGFLRGLRSLRKYFLKIQRDVRADLGLVSHLRNGDVSDLDIDMDEDEGEVSQ
ncbi:SAICAR synthase-like protein [Thozetella sp. PMI_491]|nr:SAICAR synthase-like protein [Thozetella sp. PMI_491]